MGKANFLAILVAAAFVFSLTLFSQLSSASLTFSGRDCNGNQICDVITRCDTGGCTNSFDNCQPCGVTTKVCANGVVTAPNTCSKTSGPQCVKATPACTAAQGVTDPHVILTFNVFTKKNLVVNVTPESQTGLAGSTLNYKISIENKNPKTLTFSIVSQLPAGWQINIPSEVSVSQSTQKDIPFRVMSNETAGDGNYPIVIGLFNSELSLFGTVTATYSIGSRGAPTIAANPRSQDGYPGAMVTYNISVTNNDPADFDASSISMKAIAPAGFNAVFTPSSIRLSPQETGYTRLDVTSPLTASDVNQITINATANKLSGMDFVEYRINLCGDGICGAGEENSCTKDCPSDPNFICNGRCERELDDGLAFSSTVSIPFKNFIICGRNSTVSSCIQASSRECGIGRQCLCTSQQPNCNVLCVDTRGAYYLLANGTVNARSIANYSFVCPFVDLPDIIALRDNFTSAKQSYEKSQSALRETLKASNITAARRAQTQPCVDALSSIIGTSGDFVAYLNEVIAWPGKLNTTAARARASTVRSNIESTYNTFCRSATGLLQIDSISAATVEKGNPANIAAIVSNIGNTQYFGYVQCDITGAAGEKSSSTSTCGPVGGMQSNTFSLTVNTTSAGAWKARCRTYGSVDSGCVNASLHHESTGQFNVFTRDTYIVDISGSCGQQLNCSVRASQQGCSACSVSDQVCTKTSDANGSEIFNCPRAAYGNYTIVGYVLDNSRCNPIAPLTKNITVRCTGCGDGIVDTGEQCETPFSNNNQRCEQQQATCEGRLYGVRDRLGFCTSSCGCSYDEYQFSCTRGKCGAECEDGETRTVTINSTGCSCTQQCSSTCGWNACSCEAGLGIVSVSLTGAPFVEVANSVPSAGEVTLTARGGNLTRIEIFVDGFAVRTCSSSPCVLTATYTAGVHGYFARASNSQDFAADPTSGRKSFTIAGVNVQSNSTQTNQTITTSNGISLTTSHTPSNPTADDIVTITASASTNTNRIEIFVDGFLSKKCTDFLCTFDSRYNAGTHTYFALAFDANGNSVANPTTGAKSFTVRTAAANVQQNGTQSTQANQTTPVNQTTVTNNSISLTLSHSPQAPTTANTVTITAAASTNVNRIEIYVDGLLSKICTDFLCSLGNTYSAGVHTYFALAFGSSSSVANPTTGTKSFTVTAIQTAVNGTQTTASNGTLGVISVLLDVSHSPLDITTADTVSIAATAHGPRSFREINIFVDGALRKTCTNYAPSQSCVWRSAYTEGQHSYFATATDVANNSVRDPGDGTKGFSVNSAQSTTQPAPFPIIGSGSSSNGGSPGRCYAKIESKNCTYNTATRRYDVSLSASWDNGTHAHWIVEDDAGPKIYTKSFTGTDPLSGPGLKNIKVVVHNANDSTICMASDTIYCGPGTTTGKDIDLLFDVKDVVKTGSNDVRIIVIPYNDISNARVISYTDASLSVTRPLVSGNASVAGVSGPARVTENNSYLVYTISGSLQAGKNISISYALNISRPGEYKLIAVANYSGKQDRFTKTIKATNCPQAYKVVATNPSITGSCKDFDTPCDVPPGWSVVDRCPSNETVKQQDNTMLVILLTIVVAVIAALAYKYRDSIREKLQRKQQKEELPKFDEE